MSKFGTYVFYSDDVYKCFHGKFIYMSLIRLNNVFNCEEYLFMLYFMTKGK